MQIVIISTRRLIFFRDSCSNKKPLGVCAVELRIDRSVISADGLKMDARKAGMRNFTRLMWTTGARLRRNCRLARAKLKVRMVMSYRRDSIVRALGGTLKTLTTCLRFGSAEPIKNGTITGMPMIEKTHYE